MSRRMVIGVAGCLSVLVAGVAGTAWAERAPQEVAVTGQQIDDAAATLGYGDARSPSGKFVAECMTEKGVPSTYDDETGQYSFAGDEDGAVLVSCFRDLAQIVHGLTDG